ARSCIICSSASRSICCSSGESSACGLIMGGVALPKYSGNSSSKVGRLSASLTSVARRLRRNVSRSAMPSRSIARQASWLSATETRTPAARRAVMNLTIRSSIALASHPAQSAARPLDVGLVLEQHGQRGIECLRIQRARVERDQRARPVERLADARILLEVQRAQRLHDLDRLTR